MLRHRKPRKADIAASFKRQVDLLEKLGAIQSPEDGYYYLSTRAGVLRIHLFEDEADWIACRFEDVEKAKEVIGPSGMRLNPYSGKWNWHWDREVETANLEAFEYAVRWLVNAVE